MAFYLHLENFQFKEATKDGPTVGQLLHFIGNKSKTLKEKKAALLECLAPPASKWAAAVNLNDLSQWQHVKTNMLKKYRIQLTIAEKVKLRKELKQQPFESCQDFLNRCTQCQFLICDDEMESVLERDILISFLCGLREEFYEALIKMDNLKTLESFFCEAVNIEAVIQEKKQDNAYVLPSPDADIKAEATEMSKSVKIEDAVDEEMFDDDYLTGEETFPDDWDMEEEGETDDTTPMKISDKPKTKNRSINTTIHINSESSDYEDNGADSDFDPNVKPPEYPCELCGLIYKREYKLKKHLEQHHQVNAKFKCQICEIPFTDRKMLKTHVKKIHTDLGLQCQVCHITSLSRLKAELHRHKHHPTFDEEKNHVCGVCVRPFQYLTTVLNHIRIDHFNEDPFECKKCQRKFYSKDTLNRHITIHDTELKYECNICNTKFTSKIKMYHHRHQAHSNQQGYVCEICAKSYKFKSGLTAHIARHHQSEENRQLFVCDVCGKTHNNEFSAKSHKKTHNQKEIPVECSVCSKVCKNKRVLQGHMKNHKVKKRTVKCGFCPKMFPTMSTKLTHEKRIHLNIKDLKCDQCDFATACRGHLKTHILSLHCGEMFSCDVPGCSKSYNLKGNLDAHKKRVHGIARPNELKPETIILPTQE